jgi:hypothetical protein
MPTPSSRLSNSTSACPHPVQGCQIQLKAVEPCLCMQGPLHPHTLFKAGEPSSKLLNPAYTQFNRLLTPTSACQHPLNWVWGSNPLHMQRATHHHCTTTFQWSPCIFLSPNRWGGTGLTKSKCCYNYCFVTKSKCSFITKSNKTTALCHPRYPLHSCGNLWGLTA